MLLSIIINTTVGGTKTEYHNSPLNTSSTVLDKEQKNLQKAKLCKPTQWLGYWTLKVIRVKIQAYKVFQIAQFTGNCPTNFVFVKLPANEY